MMKRDSPSRAFLAAAGVAAASPGQGAETDASIDEWIKRLKSTDLEVNSAACQSALKFGAAAVKPLAALLADSDFELARRTKRALYRIVRHAGRPGAAAEALAVETELVALLAGGPVQPRRDLLWMLSEIGTGRAVAPVAVLLMDNELREDARCALTRMPSPEAAGALKTAFARVPEDFKYALAESLRIRGQEVEGYPSRKLVPSAQTTVKPIVPKNN